MSDHQEGQEGVARLVDAPAEQRRDDDCMPQGGDGEQLGDPLHPRQGQRLQPGHGRAPSVHDRAGLLACFAARAYVDAARRPFGRRRNPDHAP